MNILAFRPSRKTHARRGRRQQLEGSGAGAAEGEVWAGSVAGSSDLDLFLLPLTASMTRERVPLVRSTRACVQYGSSISETTIRLDGSTQHCHTAAISPGQMRQVEPSSSSTLVSACLDAHPVPLRFVSASAVPSESGSVQRWATGISCSTAALTENAPVRRAAGAGRKNNPRMHWITHTHAQSMCATQLSRYPVLPDVFRQTSLCRNCGEGRVEGGDDERGKCRQACRGDR